MEPRGRFLYMRGLLAGACLLGAYLLYLLLMHLLHPSLSVRSAAGNLMSTGPIRVSVSEGTTTLPVSIAYQVSPGVPQTIFLGADDCIDRLTINSVPYQDAKFPICEFPYGRAFDLSKYISRYIVEIDVVFRNTGGNGALAVWMVPDSSLHYALYVAISGLVILPFMLFQRSKLIAWAFLLGVTLRLIYFFANPAWSWAYDAAGHFQYLQHVLENWSIPSPHAGWQYYQPPLYYFIGALIEKSAQMFVGVHLSQQNLIGTRFLSLCLSLGILQYLLSAGFIALRGVSTKAILIYSLLIAACPGLIMFTSRINNDLLVQFLLAAALYFSVRWWQDRDDSLWGWSPTLTILACQAKSNGIIFLPVVILLTAIAPWFSRKRRLILSVGSLVVVTLPLVAYSFFRYVVFNWQSLANTTYLSGDLAVSNNIINFLIFNPLAILEHPYNHNYADSERRQYFWEYVFRGVFFGEFDLGSPLRGIAGIILLLAMVLAVLAIKEILSDLFSKPRRPSAMLFMLLSSFGGLIAFRLMAPYACAQDFRYIAVVAGPMCYYVAIAFERNTSLRKPIWIGALLLTFFCALCSVRLSMLPVPLQPFFG